MRHNKENYARFIAAHPGYEKEKAKRYREEALAHYGGKCACCDESRFEFLALDHENGGGKKHRESLGKGGGYLVKWMRKNNYPKRFRVLCHNCNLSLGFYGYCPHTHKEAQ